MLSLFFFRSNIRSYNQVSIICFLLFLLMALSQIANAQFDKSGGVIVPAPNSISILKQSNTPVNLYSGIVSIPASLYELQARGGYNIPLSLLYNAVGNKVQDVASNVGLGWSMSSNSLVTRVVRGLPDEQANGYFGSDMGNKITGVLDVATLNGIRNGDLDAEPDLFYFNLNGVLGKFVFDKNKTPIVLNDKSISVINSPFKKELGVDGWILSDLQGNRYFLGTDQTCTEETQSVAYGESLNKSLSFTSTWYLKKITTANDVETINFNYESGSQIKTVNFRRSQRSSQKGVFTTKRPLKIFGATIIKGSQSASYTQLEFKEWDNNVEQIVASPKYLVSIISSNQSAYFTYDTQNARKDLTNGRVIKKIEIRNYLGESLRFYTFKHSYTFSHDIDLPSDVSTTTPDKYRLLLNGVDISPGNNLNSTTPLYIFQYNLSVNLPPRYSRRVDHWGFYNENNYGYFPSDYGQQELSKAPSEVNSQANILERIIYETGGYKEFVYEGNKFFDTKSGKNILTGGIRIAKTISSTGINSPKVTEKYRYENLMGQSSGKLVKQKPIYNVYIQNSQSEIGYRPRINAATAFEPGTLPQGAFVDDFSGFGPSTLANTVPQVNLNGGVLNFLYNTITFFATRTDTKIYYFPTLIRNFNTFNSLYDFDGNSIGYSDVIVDNGEGTTVNKFTDSEEYPDSSNQIRVNSNFYAMAVLLPDVAPFTPNTSYGFARGRLKERQIYDKNGKLLNWLTNKYEFNTDVTKVIGFKCESAKINTSEGVFQSNSNDYFNVGYYHIFAKSLLLKETEEKSYDDSEPDKFLKKTIFYNYNNSNPSLLSSQSTNNSDGSTLTTESKYVLDKDLISFSDPLETAAANTLFTQRRYGLLLQQIIKKDNEVISTSKIGYKNFTINSKQLILPGTSYNGNGTTVEPKVLFQAYDEYGNILQSSRVKDVSKVVKWGYNQLFPILECSNAELQDVFFENFENSTGSAIITGNAHSGKKYYNGQYTVSFNANAAKTYKISYWYYLNNSWNFSGYSSYSGASMLLNKGTAIDDVIIIPEDAQVATTAYSSSGGIISKTDTKGLSAYFEYDELQRIASIKDENNNIVNAYKYNYRSPLYISTKSGIYTKNDCPSGNVSSPIKYSTTATSNVSQADADNIANSDVIANGQNYANKNSVCNLMNITLTNLSNNGIPVILKLTNVANTSLTYNLTAVAPNASVVITVPNGWYSASIVRPPDGRPPTILFNLNGEYKIGGDGVTFDNTVGANTKLSYTDVYFYNTAQSGVFYKDCPSDKISSQVIYSVPPGKYVSDISQLNADDKAQQEIFTSGQSYANTNGGCRVPGEVEVTLVNNNTNSNGASAIIVQLKQSGSSIKTLSFSTAAGTYKQTFVLPSGNYDVDILMPGSGATRQFTILGTSKTGNVVSFNGIPINETLLITCN